jgi:hypothetical protein
MNGAVAGRIAKGSASNAPALGKRPLIRPATVKKRIRALYRRCPPRSGVAMDTVINTHVQEQGEEGADSVK